MESDIARFAPSLLLAGLLGFAAHRASICNVKAVEEVLTTRRAYMFASFAKTVLWTVAATLLLIFLWPETRASGEGLTITATSLAGGFVCGVGMAINNGCAFSTLRRLGDGDVAMLVTLGSFVLGAFAISPLPEIWNVTQQSHVPSPYDVPQSWAVVLLAVFGVWAVWEAVRLVRSRPAGHTAAALMLARNYRLSTAAMLIGLANGVIFALNGNWNYTTTLGQGASRLVDIGPAPAIELWALFAALFAGMVFSSWQQRSFRIVARPRWSWLRNLGGGLLMGAGAATVPGGNDALLLHGIPNLSPHAAPAYIAMVLGIAVFLACRMLLGRGLATVDCGGDVCMTR